MKPADPRELGRLASSVLADCAFLLTEPTDNADELEGEVVHAAVAIGGDSPGRLVLSAPKQLAMLVAADMLGLSPDDRDALAHAEGAVAELANVLAGAFSERFSASGSCDIGIPELHREALPWVPDANTRTATLLCDSGDLIRVSWTLAMGAEP